MSPSTVQWSLLFLLVNAFCFVDCQSPIAFTFYDVVNPVPFNGSNLTSTDNSCTVNGNRLECKPGSKLDDNSTDPTDGSSLADHLDSFFAFSRQSAQGGRLVYGFNTFNNTNALNASIIVYFFNQPSQSIGLPLLSLTTPSGSSYTFGNNSDLSQNDSSIKSVILHLIPREANNLITMIVSFNDTNIDWFLVSEVEFIQNEPSYPFVLESIVFQNGPTSLITIGPSNPQQSITISCTVLNSGSFEWTWYYNQNPLTSIDRYQILTADATRTSILTIDDSRYSDSGNYTCKASHKMDNMTYSDKIIQLELTDDLVAESENISATIGGTASLKCELYGYLSESNAAIEWRRNNQLIMQLDPDHSLTNTGGSLPTFDINGSSRSSIVTELQIKMLQESDSGLYVCLSGTRSVVVTLTVTDQIVESSSTDNILLPSLSQTSVSSTTNSNSDSTVTVVTQISSSTQVTNQNSPVSQQFSQTSSVSSLPSQNNDSSVYVIVGAIIAVVIVIILINITIITVITLTCRKHKSVEANNPRSLNRTSVQPELEPFYSEVHAEKPNKYIVITPYSETEIRSDSSNDSVRITSTAQNYELPDYSEIPEIPVRPARDFPSSPLNAVNPQVLKDNPMYTSADDLVSDCKFGGSDFNIYAEANIPPPIPDYYGTPVNSIYNASIYSVDLKPSYFKSRESLQRENDQSSPYLHPCTSIYSDPEPIIKNDVLEVTENHISEIKELGMGQFGRVIMAHTIGITLKELKLSNDDSNVSILVAVKRLSEDSDEKDRQTFEKEIKFMSRLHHENVVRLLGICLNKNAFIMMEYMENGDLSQYLQKFEFTPEEATSGYLSVSVLVYMCLQVAAGMRYLASLSFVHRDLAARNCLVGQKHVIKIADFGMSRKLYDRNYYRIQGKAVLPIRWMSSECFYGRFSEKTDVWAFGVTMWEIFNFSRVQPYDKFDDQEVVNNAIKGQNTVLLDQPKPSPDDVYHIMSKCWHHDPDNRPSFEDLHGYLSQIHAYSDMK